MKKPVDYFFDAAKKWPENDFLCIPACKSGDIHRPEVNLTYRTAENAILALVDKYTEMGIVAGARVGLLLENSADFFLHWLALNHVGAALVPVNKELAPEDCAHIIRDSALCLIVCFDDLKPIAEAALEYVDSVVKIWTCDSADFPSLQSKAIAANGECALLYTSGSTGLPKGCILTNEYFEVAGKAYLNLGGICALEDGKERLVTPLPQVHMNALACSNMAMIMTGGCIIQLDRFHPRSWWKQVVDTKATVIHYLGVVPAILLQLPECEEEKQHTIKFGFGAGVNPKHHAVFEERYGFPLAEAWSMTEVGGAGWIVASHEPRHVGECCFGRADDTMEYRLVGDSDVDVPLGTPGELLVRSKGDNPRYGFFSGYHGQPVLTEEVWSGGWLHTGDIVREGEDGSLFFIDRKKSIIRRSGENISSLEVETVLSEIKSVQAVGVTPVPDDLRGEEVMACIVLEGDTVGSGETAHAIVTQALERLAYYKVPGYVTFMEALPLTPSQKLQRGELKKIAKALIETYQVHDVTSLKKRQKVQ